MNEITDEMVEAAIDAWHKDWSEGPPEQNEESSMRAALTAALASRKEEGGHQIVFHLTSKDFASAVEIYRAMHALAFRPSPVPEWAQVDVIPLGGEIDRLIEAMFDDTNQTAASELKQLLWDNKVGICRLLQHLSRPSPDQGEVVEECARRIQTLMDEAQGGYWNGLATACDAIRSLSGEAPGGKEDTGRYMTAEEIAADKSIIRGAPAPAPEGWRTVPVEPTQGMLRDGNHVAGELFHNDDGYSAGSVYRAMLAAAPPPPLNPVEGKEK